MEETKDPNAQDDSAGPRDAEATSSETLSDIEDNEKIIPDGASSESSSPTETNSPDPDAGGEGRADGSETGGPM